MDYRIDFSLAQDIGLAKLLGRLEARSSDISREGARYVIAGQTIVHPSSDEGVDLKNASEEALFILLNAYFDEVAGTENGALVTMSDEGALTVVAISNEEDLVREEISIGLILPADEILANREVFLAAWPAIVESHFDEDVAPEDAPRVNTAQKESDMLFANILPSPQDESDLVSFMIFGASAEEIMTTLVRPSSYAVEDEDFLRADFPDQSGAVEVVGFNTSKGYGFELRLPLEQARIEDAIKLVAQQAAPLKITPHYVTDIIDEEETFIIQRIEADGFLAEPERIKLQ